MNKPGNKRTKKILVWSLVIMAAAVLVFFVITFLFLLYLDWCIQSGRCY